MMAMGGESATRWQRLRQRMDRLLGMRLGAQATTTRTVTAGLDVGVDVADVNRRLDEDLAQLEREVNELRDQAASPEWWSQGMRMFSSSPDVYEDDDGAFDGGYATTGDLSDYQPRRPVRRREPPPTSE